MPNSRDVIRYLWAAPTTALGLPVVAAGLWRARVRVVDGVIEAHGPWLAWMLVHLAVVPGGVSAVTFGHVVVAQDDGTLAATRAHERVHVRQYEIWGPLFVPAYLAASLAAVMRGRHLYFGNRFEIEAFAHGAASHEHEDAQPGRDRFGGRIAMASRSALAELSTAGRGRPKSATR